MHYLTISSLLVLATISNASAQEAKPSTYDQFMGTWGLDSEDGYGSWLKVQRDDLGEVAATLLWRVGSAREPRQIELVDGDLSLSFRRNRKVDGKRVTINTVYTVRRVPGPKPRIEVVEARFGASGKVLRTDPRSAAATGTRLPEMPKPPDLKKIQFGPAIELFNGRDLSGWQLKPATAKNGWRVENGELVNVTPKTDFSAYGEHGNLRTTTQFKDHQLHIEFNVEKNCNSGVYVRGMYEAQVVDRDSRMQGIQGVGAVFGRIAPTKQAGLAGGKWQTYDITLVDRHITVVLNGQKVIDNQPIEGCTGGALLGDITKAGPLYLQGDHTSVRYRNIRVRKRIK